MEHGEETRQAVSSLPVQAVLLGPILLAIVGTVALWEEAAQDRRNLLALFALAGAIGGFLRSSAYALATRSFSQREFRQWKAEALFAPVLGAASGLGAYLFVDAALVGGAGVNQAGQYLVSLLAGTAALSIVGQYVERGLARSATSRSGVLGGQPSGALPLIGRFDELLDERLSEQTTVNFTGFVELSTTSGGPAWVFAIQFMSHDFEPHREYDPPDSDIRRIRVPVEVLGGVDRPVVPFTVSVVSAFHRGLPAVLAVAVPREGMSSVAQLLVERTAGIPAPGQEYVAVEIGQAGATWQILKVELPDASQSYSGP